MVYIHKTETVFKTYKMKTLNHYFNDMKTRRKLMILIGIIIGLIVFVIQFPML